MLRLMMLAMAAGSALAGSPHSLEAPGDAIAAVRHDCLSPKISAEKLALISWDARLDGEFWRVHGKVPEDQPTHFQVIAEVRRDGSERAQCSTIQTVPREIHLKDYQYKN